jgi:hypothetical protein
VGGGVIVVAGAGVLAGVEVGVAVAAGEGVVVGVPDGVALTVAEREGDSEGVGDADGEIAGVGLVVFLVTDFLCRRGVGVGVGLTNTLLILSNKVSFAAAPRASAATAIHTVSAITVTQCATLIAILLYPIAANSCSTA